METLAAHVQEKGAAVVGPVPQPWNVREVTVTDPNGYRLVFTTL